MNGTTGTLFGIGVGPGDPDLIPVKAVHILSRVDRIFTASSTKNRHSLAVDIARRHIPESTPVEVLAFPMCRELAAQEKAWLSHAARIVEFLESGRSAAFLTLGDPLTYSTYGYVLRSIRSGWPDVPIETVPGITSYQAAAAATHLPLVEGEQSLLILSGVHGGEHLRNIHPAPDNVVFLKAYRNIDGICEALRERGMIERSVGVSDCGRQGQRIHTDVSRLKGGAPNYWTLIIAKREGPDAKKP